MGFISACADPEGGTGDPPEKSQIYRVFELTGPDPATKPASNVGHFWPASEGPFQLPAFDGFWSHTHLEKNLPAFEGFWSLTPLEKTYQNWTPSAKLSGSAHEGI